MRWLRGLLSHDRVGWLAAGELVAGGIGALGANRLSPQGSEAIPFWLLYWCVVVASWALVVHAILSFIILAYERWRIVWESRTRWRFRKPFYLEPLVAAPSRVQPVAPIAGPAQTASSTPVLIDRAPVPDDGDFPFRVVLVNDGDIIALRILNNAHKARFRAEVGGIRSPHFNPLAEPTDWPWPIKWRAAGERALSETLEIEAAGRGEVMLCIFDTRGALRQVQNRGGYAFKFPAPRNEHLVHGRLGVTTIEQLKLEVLKVQVDVARLGEPEIGQSLTVCFPFGGPAKFCEPDPMTAFKSWTKKPGQ